MKAIRLRLLLVCLALSLSAVAQADTAADAWAAAKTAIAPDSSMVLGMDLAALKGSQLFQTLFPQLLAQAGGAREGLDKIKTTCGIDVLSAVAGGVAAVDETQQGAIYVSSKGLTQARVTECMMKVVAKESPATKVTASKPDAQGIVEYSISGEEKHYFIAFLPKNVLVLATEPSDKAQLQRWLSGKGVGPGTVVARALGTLNTSSPFWIVMKQEKSFAPEVTATMKAIYGHADIVGGLVNADIHVITGTTKEATDLSAFAQKQLDAVKQSGSLPPTAITLMQAVKIAPTNDELQLKASVPEKDVASFLQATMGH